MSLGEWLLDRIVAPLIVGAVTLFSAFVVVGVAVEASLHIGAVAAIAGIFLTVWAVGRIIQFVVFCE